jgi:hypothetical protein
MLSSPCKDSLLHKCASKLPGQRRPLHCTRGLRSLVCCGGSAALVETQGACREDSQFSAVRPSIHPDRCVIAFALRSDELVKYVGQALHCRNKVTQWIDSAWSERASESLSPHLGIRAGQDNPRLSRHWINDPTLVIREARWS